MNFKFQLTYIFALLPLMFQKLPIPFYNKTTKTSYDISIPFRELHNLKYATAAW